MASPRTKTYRVDSIPAPILVTKRRASRSIKMRVQSSVVKVSIPPLTPYGAGVFFAEKNRTWILEQLTPERSVDNFNGVKLFDNTTVEILLGNERNSVRRQAGKISLLLSGESSQKQLKFIDKTLTNHLRAATELAVAPLIDELGVSHQLYPEQLKYKRVTSRWGSCSNQGVLTFSVFVAQLEPKLTRYIVAHELSHLKHMDHGKNFWDLVMSIDPEYKLHRKMLKDESMDFILKTT